MSRTVGGSVNKGKSADIPRVPTKSESQTKLRQRTLVPLGESVERVGVYPGGYHAKEPSQAAQDAQREGLSSNGLSKTACPALCYPSTSTGVGSVR